MSAKISIIAAVADNGIIGRGNTLPWHIASEFRYFMTTTIGHPIVLGRKCYESLGAVPLKKRTNIIVTRNANYRAPGAEVVTSLDAALARAQDIARNDGIDEIFIAGGADIYRATLPLADRLYLTEIHMKPAGDIFFPAFDRAQWQETKRAFHKAQDGEEADYTITVLARRHG